MARARRKPEAERISDTGISPRVRARKLREVEPVRPIDPEDNPDLSVPSAARLLQMELERRVAQESSLTDLTRALDDLSLGQCLNLAQTQVQKAGLRRAAGVGLLLVLAAALIMWPR